MNIKHFDLRVVLVAALAIGGVVMPIKSFGDSAESILTLWREGDTNEFQRVMARRLASDPADIPGLLMKYHWQRVFSWDTPEGVTALTNTIVQLIATAEVYKGPHFAPDKRVFLEDLQNDIVFVARTRTLQERDAYSETISQWNCWRFMMFHKDVLHDLESDGAFLPVPTPWTEDPSLYRVAESDTNLLACVNALWSVGSITNVSLIASRRLQNNPDDPIGSILALDCARAFGDSASISNLVADATGRLSSLTNSPALVGLAHEFYDDASLMLSEAQEGLSTNAPPQPLPYFGKGLPYPHAALIKEIQRVL